MVDQNVSDAAATGSRLGMLLAMQTRLAGAIDDPATHPRDLAALTRRLLEITKEIETVEASVADEREKQSREEEARNGSAAFDPASI